MKGDFVGTELGLGFGDLVAEEVVVVLEFAADASVAGDEVFELFLLAEAAIAFFAGGGELGFHPLDLVGAGIGAELVLAEVFADDANFACLGFGVVFAQRVVGALFG